MFLGAPPATHDRILDFSTPVTGTLFFVPSADFLDDPPDPSDQPTADQTAAAAATTGQQFAGIDLGIGDLKESDV